MSDRQFKAVMSLSTMQDSARPGAHYRCSRMGPAVVGPGVTRWVWLSQWSQVSRTRSVLVLRSYPNAPNSPGKWALCVYSARPCSDLGDRMWQRVVCAGMRPSVLPNEVGTMSEDSRLAMLEDDRDDFPARYRWHGWVQYVTATRAWVVDQVIWDAVCSPPPINTIERCVVDGEGRTRVEHVGYSRGV